MSHLTVASWLPRVNLVGRGLVVRVGLPGRQSSMGPRFWNVADYRGRPVPKIGSWTSALATPPGKLLPLPVGPAGEVDTVSHWICPCATKIVDNKGGKTDK
jgi:hypothetical protein